MRQAIGSLMPPIFKMLRQQLHATSHSPTGAGQLSLIVPMASTPKAFANGHTGNPHPVQVSSTVGESPAGWPANQVRKAIAPGSGRISVFESKRSNHQNMNQTQEQLSRCYTAAKGSSSRLQLLLCVMLLAATAVAAPAPAAAGKEKQGGHASKAQPEWPAGINRCQP